MEITRSSILREVLVEKENEMFKFSKFRAGLTPLPGYEQIFEDRRKECDLLRGMIRSEMDREHETEAAKRMADWQKDLMDGKQPDMNWADENNIEGPIRKAMVSGEIEPVTYPGGE